ncbi:translation machinery-associated protein 16-like [Lingula anatina]|uniref:Translation machinery-associated protein 16-like n=1 Tax=Lingula anatina TaxID=7574 RepID=A0A1S3IDH8_LINAN|nr:translation machinery-associated protein 16-like [Lingula anatina]|eukprot:XP_013396292.1 translation machinery-associated protein 16-like [Lingula anatina]
MPKAPKANIPGRQKPIHPQSRKAAQLARQANHEQRVHRAHGDQATKLEVLGNKLLWFKENVDLQKKVYSKLELCLLVEEYLHRFDEEMEQIELIKNSLKTRQGGQHMSRETAIKTTLERDRREYEEMGIEVPDILNGKRLKYFR